ncbi:MAG: UDP-N-acetylmuramate--L-alanine ligase [Tepidisphaeraceae bacterium]|jgi:UDP-N-acetylmuramate--alanine ligase
MDAALAHKRLDARPAFYTLPSSQFHLKRVHFIGVGGCGMSGLANMLIDAGALVTGSEPKPNSLTFQLNRRGAKISRDQLGELLNKTINLVVRSAAISDANDEYRAAKAMGLPVVKYAQLLGMVMKERTGLAVAGTHGKTTTSAMISYVLQECGADPSFVIGGTAPQLGGSSRSGTGQIFVAEACEFDRSFHNLHPKIAIITNIEEDHLDCYKNIGEIIEAFRTFASQVPSDGLIIAGGDDPHVREALQGASAPIQFVGLNSDYSWSTRKISIDNGCHVGEVCFGREALGTLRLSVSGEHNLLNATMAMAACVACGMDGKRVMEALGRFTGVERRMTLVGIYRGAIVVDDYGHHPTEIRATLAALRERFSPRRLLCVFQPHQHSRTRFLLEDFAASFALADETIVPDIYFVRDSDAEKQRVCAEDLVRRVETHGQSARYLPKFSQIVEYLKRTAGEGDLIVTMGAGNVWEIAKELIA